MFWNLVSPFIIPSHAQYLNLSVHPKQGLSEGIVKPSSLPTGRHGGGLIAGTLGARHRPEGIMSTTSASSPTCPISPEHSKAFQR